MKKTPRRIIPPLFALCAIMFLAACTKPADPLATPITANTPEEFTAWKNVSSQKIPSADMQELDACVNEIRLGIMQRREAAGAGPIAQKLCEYINGKTPREVIIMGYTATTAWVPKELALQRENVRKTEEALNGPGSDEKKRGLRDYLAVAKDNNAKLQAKLEKAEARLAELQTK